MRDPAERCGAARCASRSGPFRIALEENSSCRPDFCAPDPQGIGAGFISSSGPPGVSSVRPEENSGVRNGVLSRSTGGGLRSLRTPDPRGSGAEFSSGRPRGSSPPVGRRRIPPSSLPPFSWRKPRAASVLQGAPPTASVGAFALNRLARFGSPLTRFVPTYERHLRRQRGRSHGFFPHIPSHPLHGFAPIGSFTYGGRGHMPPPANVGTMLTCLVPASGAPLTAPVGEPACRTPPISACTSRASCPHHLRPKWARTHATPAFLHNPRMFRAPQLRAPPTAPMRVFAWRPPPISAHPSHGPCPHRELHLRPQGRAPACRPPQTSARHHAECAPKGSSIYGTSNGARMPHPAHSGTSFTCTSRAPSWALN